jgi:catechol 2,3-dioxygenase-like lactoylglutathione lyase family enzyme
MLNNARVATRLPTQDLDRARRFYSEKLGLEPIEERPASGSHCAERFRQSRFAAEKHCRGR